MRKPRKTPKQPAPAAATTDPAPAPPEPKPRRRIWPGAAVRFGDGCPNCGSTRNRIVENYGVTDFGSFGVVERIHECDGDGCGWSFKSSQRVPRKDIPHYHPSTQDKREKLRAEGEK